MKGIYKIENMINGKVYIGSSVDISKRFVDHRYFLNKERHHNIYLQRAWNKYGEKCFKFEVIEECENLIEREQYWMNKTKSKYNIQKQCVSTFLGVKRSAESRRKMSIAKKGRKMSEEQKEIRRIKSTGKKHTEESKKKMSDNRKGKPISEEQKAYLSKINTGEGNPNWGTHHRPYNLNRDKLGRYCRED